MTKSQKTNACAQASRTARRGSDGASALDIEAMLDGAIKAARRGGPAAGRDYLARQARKNPQTFLVLLGLAVADDLPPVFCTDKNTP